jgi:hypothetical protein
VTNPGKENCLSGDMCISTSKVPPIKVKHPCVRDYSRLQKMTACGSDWKVQNLCVLCGKLVKK